MRQHPHAHVQRFCPVCLYTGEITYQPDGTVVFGCGHRCKTEHDTLTREQAVARARTLPGGDK